MSGCVCCVWNFIRCSCKSCLAVCVVFEIYVVSVRVFVFYYKLYVVYVKCVCFLRFLCCWVILCCVTFCTSMLQPWLAGNLITPMVFGGGSVLCYILYIYVTIVYLLNALYILLNLAVLIFLVCFNCFTVFLILFVFRLEAAC